MKELCDPEELQRTQRLNFSHDFLAASHCEPMMFHFVALLHLFSTAMLTGLIWTIQVVHYPSFLWIEKKEFVRFEGFHAKSISLIVVPLMLCEILTAIALCVFNEALSYNQPFLISIVALGLIWLSTFAVQVPLHSKLAEGWSEEHIRTLIRTNWFRTILWTVRIIILGELFLTAPNVLALRLPL